MRIEVIHAGHHDSSVSRKQVSKIQLVMFSLYYDNLLNSMVIYLAVTILTEKRYQAEILTFGKRANI